MINDTLNEADQKMGKSVEATREEFAAIRAGRANPSMFNKLVAEYYGSLTPIQQLASFAAQDARTIIVTPFDMAALDNIEKAIRDSDLGVNPSNDGALIRVIIPQLTEERRKEMVKVAKGKGEDAKIAIRNVRRKANEELHRIQKDGEAGEDEVGRAEKQLQHLTDKYVSQVEELVKHKEAELLEV